MNNATGMNTSLFNMSEMWTIPITGAALQMRPASFVPNFGPNRQVSADADSAEAAGAARKRREKDASEDDSAKAKGVCTAMSGKRLKISEFGDDDDSMKADGEDCSGKGAEQDTRAMAKPPKDCIHVRARRGQATDSHSLAERARREKISERMRVLQDLVPGCNKVIGKALVLDEIINYIQSLQHQVEFLSMKLEAVNSRLMPGIEAFPADFGRQAFDASGMAYGSQIYEPLGEYGQASSPEWSNMQLGGGV